MLFLEKRRVTVNVTLSILIPAIIAAVGLFLFLFGKRITGAVVIVIALIVLAILNSQRFKRFYLKSRAYTCIEKTYSAKGTIAARYVEVVHWPFIDQAFLKRRYFVAGTIGKKEIPFRIEVSGEKWQTLPEKAEVILTAIEYRDKNGKLITAREWTKVKLAPKPKPKPKPSESKADASKATGTKANEPEANGKPNTAAATAKETDGKARENSGKHQ